MFMKIYDKQAKRDEDINCAVRQRYETLTSATYSHVYRLPEAKFKPWWDELFSWNLRNMFVVIIISANAESGVLAVR